jgi:cyclic pyranopterin monophosphate synthase
MEKPLNHFNQAGEAHMVYVGDKPVTRRVAAASGRIVMQPETYAIILRGVASKGDVLSVARLAGIMAVKRTPELIPLSHNITTEGCSVDFMPEEKTCSIKAICSVTTVAKTGAEMEALTGVAASLLTIYDMVKAVDRGMQITDIRLEKKSGGKSGDFSREDQNDR